MHTVLSQKRERGIHTRVSLSCTCTGESEHLLLVLLVGVIAGNYLTALDHYFAPSKPFEILYLPLSLSNYVSSLPAAPSAQYGDFFFQSTNFHRDIASRQENFVITRPSSKHSHELDI